MTGAGIPSDSSISLPSPGHLLTTHWDHFENQSSPSGTRGNHIPASPSLHARAYRTRQTAATVTTPGGQSKTSRNFQGNEPLFLMSSSPANSSFRLQPPTALARSVLDTSQTPAGNNSARRAAQAAAVHERRRWREANRLRHRQADTLQELIMFTDPAILHESGELKSVAPELRARLETAGVTVLATDESEEAFPSIRFQRRVQANYNPLKRLWEPLAVERIETEHTRLFLASSADLVAAVEDGSLSSRLKISGLSEDRPVLLVLGMDTWLKQQRARDNRAFAAGVRQRMEGRAEVTVQLPSVDLRDQLDSALLRLQLLDKCHVIHAANAEEAAEWVYAVACDVSFRPYKYVAPNLDT